MDTPKRFLHTAPTAYPLPVRLHAMAIDSWLREVAAYRKRLEPDDRYEALLWSWPIRHAVTKAPSRALWECAHTDDETLACRQSVFTRLQGLAGEWYPFTQPSSDPTFRTRCATIYADLLALDVAHDDLEGPEIEGFLTELIEQHWGDGEYEARSQLLRDTLKQIKKQHWPRVYSILEQARDHAYLSVQTTRRLDAMRTTKQRLGTFMAWLKEASHQEDFVEAQLGLDARKNQPVLNDVFGEQVSAFSDAFKVMLAHKRGVRGFLEEGLKPELTHEGRDKRQHVGKPAHEWTADAQQKLKRLHVSIPNQRALLQACALMPLERD